MPGGVVAQSFRVTFFMVDRAEQLQIIYIIRFFIGIPLSISLWKETNSLLNNQVSFFPISNAQIFIVLVSMGFGS